jgi:AraC-like DNA-binding protein
MTVSEIGAALGYGDPAYFNRFFSRGVGLSPGRFRDSQPATPPHGAREFVRIDFLKMRR